MNNINIGATFARERRSAGITQDQLAAHVGVSKAAVSKWELGQSLPDVALLPRIAAYFQMTLDDLFDYRPQLTKEQINSLYVDLLNEFAEDQQKAYVHLEQLTVEYYSCWPFLIQMAVLYMNRILAEPERTEALLAKGEALLLRVEDQCGDVGLVAQARFVRGMMLQGKGDTRGAISLLESLKPEMPFGVEPTLAMLYQANGNMDASLQLYQESVYHGLMNMMSSLSSQLLLPGLEQQRLDALLRAGEGMVQGFALGRWSQSAAVSFLGAAATACLRAGDEVLAREYLQRFVDAMDTCGPIWNIDWENSPLFDRLPEEVTGDPRATETMNTQFSVESMKDQFKMLVTSYEPWPSFANDTHFKPLLDRLAAL